MSKLGLTIACGNYDRTRPLLTGEIQPEGIDLNCIPLRPGEVFWRMLNNAEFDASEMSLSSYSILRSEGDTRFIAIPVFPSRVFRHSAIYINANSDIRKPQDLIGKRIGVGDYQMTAAVWVRGLLQHDYQVRPQDVRWVAGESIRKIRFPEDVAIETLSPEKSLETMLEAGEIDALISVMIPRAMRSDHSTIQRLFPDFKKVEQEYYQRTQIFPIMHTFVIKSSLLEAEPWVAVSLYKAFVEAKELCSRRMHDTDALTVSLPWIIDEVEASWRLFGKDIWNYTVKGSRPTLEALTTYLDEQGLTRKPMSPDELFVPQIQQGLADYLNATGEA